MAFDGNPARFTVNTLPSEDVDGNRGVVVANSAAIELQLETIPSGALSATFQLFDAADPTSPLASLDAPALTFDGSGTALELLTDPDTETSEFTFAASGIHAYLVRCTTAHASGPRVFERTIVSRGALSSLRKTFPAESQEFEARGWSDELNRMVDAIESAVAGGSSLQQAYILGNTIDSTVAAGPVLINTTEVVNALQVQRSGVDHIIVDTVGGIAITASNAQDVDISAPEGISLDAVNADVTIDAFIDINLGKTVSNAIFSGQGSGNIAPHTRWEHSGDFAIVNGHPRFLFVNENFGTDDAKRWMMDATASGGVPRFLFGAGEDTGEGDEYVAAPVLRADRRDAVSTAVDQTALFGAQILFESTNDDTNVTPGVLIKPDTGGNTGDAHQLLTLESVGSNSGAVVVRVGNRNPDSNITGLPGDFYCRSNGVLSALYQHTGAGSSSTDWTVLGAGGGVADLQGAYDGGQTIDMLAATGDLVIDATDAVAFELQKSSSNVVAMDTAGAVDITPPSGQDVTVTTGGAGNAVLNAYTFPTLNVDTFVFPDTDGSNGDVLATDGAGNLSFTPAGGGVADLQGAYAGGSTIAVTTANGAIALSNTADVTNVLEVSRTFAGAGHGIEVTMGASATGDGLNVDYDATTGAGGAAVKIDVDAASSAQGLEVTHNGSAGSVIQAANAVATMLDIVATGAIAIATNSDQDLDVTSEGSGAASFGASGTGDTTITSVGGILNLLAGATGTVEMNVNSNLLMDVTSAGAITFTPGGTEDFAVTSAAAIILDADADSGFDAGSGILFLAGDQVNLKSGIVIINVAGAVAIAPTSGQDFDATAAGAGDINLTVATGSINTSGDVQLGDDSGDTITMGGASKNDTVFFFSDLEVGVGVVTIGLSTSDYLSELWLDAVGVGGPNLAAYDLQAFGTNAGAWAIGVDPALTSNSSATELMDMLVDLDAAISVGGGESLQQTYAIGNTIAVTTANGAVAIDNSTDVTDVMTIDRTFAGGGAGLIITMGVSTTGSGLEVEHLGSGTAFKVAAGGTDVLTMDAAGDFTVLTASGEDASLQTAGAGNVTVSATGSGGATLGTSGVGDINILSGSGEVLINTTQAVFSAAGAISFTPTSGQDFDATVAGVGDINLTVATGSINTSGDVQLGDSTGDTINIGGGTSDTVNLLADLEPGAGVIGLGVGLTEYFDEVWVQATNDNGPDADAYNLNANGANAGAYAIGVNPSLTDNSASTDLMTMLDDLDAAITAVGVDTLQTAYAAGNTVAVTTGNGSIDLSNSADATTVLEVSRTFAGGGNCLDVIVGSDGTGSAVEINHQGTGTALKVRAASTDVLVMDAAGDFAVLTATDEDASLQTAGTGTVTVSATGSGGATLGTSGAGDVNVLSASGQILFNTTQGVFSAAGAIDFAPTSGQDFGATAAGVGDINLTVATGSINTSGDVQLGDDSGDTINLGGASKNDTVFFFSDLEVGTGVVNIGLSTSDYLNELWLDAVGTGGPNLAAYNLQASGANAGAWAIGVNPALTANSSATELMEMLDDLDGAISASSSLQSAYAVGNTIAVTTANGAIQLSNVADVTNVLEIDRTFVGAGHGLEIDMGPGDEAVTGDGARITSGTGATGAMLFIDNYGSGAAFEVQDAGSQVLVINGNGSVEMQPTSGQDLQVGCQGVGQVTLDTETGSIDLTSSGAGISLDAAAASNFSTSAGDLTFDAAAAELVFDDVGNSGLTLSQTGDRTLDLTGAGELYESITSLIGALNAVGNEVAGPNGGLQGAYNNGPTIDVTAAGGAVTIDTGSEAVAGFIVQDNSVTVFEVDAAGAVLVDPTSGQGFAVITLGSGDITLNADGDIVLTGTEVRLDTSTPLDVNDNRIDNYKRAQTNVETVASSSGTATYNFLEGNYFRTAMTENITTVAQSNGPASGKGQSVMIVFVQDSTPRTLPASWAWVDHWIPAAGAPVIGTGSGDILFVSIIDNGNEVIGNWWAE